MAARSIFNVYTSANTKPYNAINRSSIMGVAGYSLGYSYNVYKTRSQDSRL